MAELKINNDTLREYQKLLNISGFDNSIIKIIVDLKIQNNYQKFLLNFPKEDNELANNLIDKIIEYCLKNQKKLPKNQIKSVGDNYLLQWQFTENDIQCDTEFLFILYYSTVTLDKETIIQHILNQMFSFFKKRTPASLQNIISENLVKKILTNYRKKCTIINLISNISKISKTQKKLAIKNLNNFYYLLKSLKIFEDLNIIDQVSYCFDSTLWNIFYKKHINGKENKYLKKMLTEKTISNFTKIENEFVNDILNNNTINQWCLTLEKILKLDEDLIFEIIFGTNNFYIGMLFCMSI